MSLASSVWIIVLVIGLVLLVIFLAMYWKNRNGEVGTWGWGILFIALFVILLAFILQLVIGKNKLPPSSEFMYHHPGWLQQSEGVPFPQGYGYTCPPYFSKGLTLAQPQTSPSPYSLMNPGINRIVLDGKKVHFNL